MTNQDKTTSKIQSKKIKPTNNPSEDRTVYRLEGVVQTSVERPDRGKVYGNILGKDGKYYGFGWPLNLKDVVEEGNNVSFIPIAGKDRYFARSIKQIKSEKGARYDFPDEVVVFREKPPRGMVVLKTFDVYVVGADRGSPANVIERVKHLAKEIGANGVRDMRRFSTTDYERGTGSGLHYYTVHNFYAKPCLMGIPTTQGGEYPEKRISEINQTIEETLQSSLELWQRKQKRATICWGIAILAWICTILFYFKSRDFMVFIVPIGLSALAGIESVQKFEPFRLSSTPPSNAN